MYLLPPFSEMTVFLQYRNDWLARVRKLVSCHKSEIRPLMLVLRWIILAQLLQRINKTPSISTTQYLLRALACVK